MKIQVLSLATLAALTFAGCTKESAPGGPGASRTAPGQERSVADANKDDENTFELAVPSTDTNLAQGARQDVTISIDRGDHFTQTVKLAFKAPAGVTVTPTDAVIQPGAEEVKVTVEAAADATVGETNIEVTATPETGKPVSMQFPVEIKTEG
jgi:uncharacterized membrane protein